jgi:hypothetical protein
MGKNVKVTINQAYRNYEYIKETESNKVTQNLLEISYTKNGVEATSLINL